MEAPACLLLNCLSWRNRAKSDMYSPFKNSVEMRRLCPWLRF